MFEDEVEYEANTEVRERYQKYKYMRSFIKNEWNMYDSLPDFYQKLFVFDNINRIKSRVKKLHQQETCALENYYVTFYFD